jgi:hypothetical protein
VVTQRSLSKPDCCRCLSDSRGKFKLKEEAIDEILVADTNLESGAKASDVEDYFEVEEEGGGGTATPTTGSLSRSRTTGCKKWWVTKLGTASQKEHKYSFVFWSSKRWGKK